MPGFHPQNCRWIAVLLASAVAAFPVLADSVDEDSNAAFTQAMEQAVDNPALPFAIEVQCTDEKGIRRFSLYPSGALIWEDQRQAHADSTLRKILIMDLQNAGFARFEKLYGGNVKPAEAKAPLQVFCRITAEIGSRRKTSAHAVGGEEFEPLLKLAATLLDHVEPLGSKGIMADELTDALGKLETGILAPETLKLRLVQFQSGTGAGPGRILRMEAGKVGLNEKRPGEAAQQVVWRPATSADIAAAVNALTAAGFADLPVNVPGMLMTELEVEVLGHEHTVIARPFTRIQPGELAEEGRRFFSLAENLLEVTETPHQD